MKSFSLYSADGTTCSRRWGRMWKHTWLPSGEHVLIYSADDTMLGDPNPMPSFEK